MTRRVTLALALCAIPAAAFGQTVSCSDCRHVASWFQGDGGFIGTVADGAEDVVFVASCGSVSTTGEASVDGGVATLLFNRRNGLACGREGGSLEIAGLKDGGWFWITDAMNSAVGNLIAKDILDNDPVEITSAGDGVTMTAGKGATFLKETATGRVGILPHIVPEPPTPALRKCGFTDRGSTGTSAAANNDAANARYRILNSECALGDGGTITLATTTNSFTGMRRTVADKGAIARPSGSGSVVVTIDLWGNGSGHFTTSPTGHALLGQPAAAGTDAGRGFRLTGVTYTARLGSGPTGAEFANGDEQAGITMDTSTTTNVVTFTIAADSAYCATRPPTNNPAVVSVTALMTDPTGPTQVTPSVSRNAQTNAIGGTSFTVVCP